MQNKAVHGFRLSPQQRRLWLLQQDSQVYRTHCAILIKGNLKVETLKECLRSVVDCHEILRTTFQSLPGMMIPVQVITNSGIQWTPSEDLSDCSPEERTARIEACVHQMMKVPFDFERGPLLHLSLITLSSSMHMLFIALPALCGDITTLNNLVKEIGSAYTAWPHSTLDYRKRKGHNKPLQYADLSEFLNELLESEETEAGRACWQELDCSSVLTLKFPFEKESGDRFDPQFLTVTIPSEIVREIQVLAETYGTNAAISLFACWQILIHRYMSRSNVFIGMGANGRNDEDLAEVMGLFAKYLPVHCPSQENPLFSTFLGEVDLLTREVNEWQEYFSWEHLHQSIDNEIEIPFFPVCFDFEPQPRTMSVGEIEFSISQQYTCVDRYHIKLVCQAIDEEITAALFYDENRFCSADIERLARQFITLLESVVSQPDAPIGELDILSNSEKQFMLVSFNQTEQDFPKYLCLHHLFEAQVSRTPDAIAVVFENQQLTYGQLNFRANQLAHYLQKQGVGPEVLVGILLERSVEMMVGLLGILKAGGAYVPLDVSHPAERLAFMLSDAKVKVLLTQQQVIKQLPENEAQVVCLEANWDTIAQQSSENPVSEITPQNLAYVIYTSGSTGRPKGVAITHEGLVNYLSWCIDAYPVADGQGTLVHSSISFDLTITSLFPPLLVGRRVQLLPEVRGIEALSTALRTGNDFSLVKITPSHLGILSQYLQTSTISKIHALVIGGEALFGEHLSFWQAYAPNTRLINEYGPTETVVGCCIYEVLAATPLSGAVPIGIPIANTQLYVLSQHLHPVPVGVSGELYIGGTGVARGYINRPEQTAEKFIPSPFSNQPGSRVYGSGDLTCSRPDGNIEFQGRIDHQVKIYGYRIEPSEIEVILSQHPAVQQTSVIARMDEHGRERLIAYVISCDEHAQLIGQLRQFLLEKLPDYMIPSSFVILSALPLLPSGKVDKGALTRVSGLRPKLEAIYMPPRTEVERAIAGIWREVLHIQKVGVNDNFFDLGGDSFLMVELHSQLQEVLNRDLSLINLFNYPSINALSKFLNQDNEQLSLQQDDHMVEKIGEGKERLKQLFKQTK